MSWLGRLGFGPYADRPKSIAGNHSFHNAHDVQDWYRYQGTVYSIRYASFTVIQHRQPYNPFPLYCLRPLSHCLSHWHLHVRCGGALASCRQEPGTLACLGTHPGGQVLHSMYFTGNENTDTGLITNMPLGFTTTYYVVDLYNRCITPPTTISQVMVLQTRYILCTV